MRAGAYARLRGDDGDDLAGDVGQPLLCGVGPSGPQVVEGWHSVPFGKPLLRTREYIAIIHEILERKAPLEFHGEHYRISYTWRGATGLSKPRRSIIHGNPDLKIYTAAIAPARLRTVRRGGGWRTGSCGSLCRPRGPRRSSARLISRTTSRRSG
jgi:hypothetical protein